MSRCNKLISATNGREFVFAFPNDSTLREFNLFFDMVEITVEHWREIISDREAKLYSIALAWKKRNMNKIAMYFSCDIQIYEELPLYYPEMFVWKTTQNEIISLRDDLSAVKNKKYENENL
jgi:hypothetical protein